MSQTVPKVQGIYSVYIISKSGGLIYNYDVESSFPVNDVEKTFSFPLDIHLEYVNQRLVVSFGQRDNIKVGHALIAINGQPVVGRKFQNIDILDDYLKNEDNYPISLKFGVPRLSTNERIVLASMFHSMYAIAALQIVPRNSQDKLPSSSFTGIEYLETNNFKLNCYQTPTGVKFIVITDLRDSSTSNDVLLKKIYELYTDYALKNPFYKLDMPIRCELFDLNVTQLLESPQQGGDKL